MHVDGMHVDSVQSMLMHVDSVRNGQWCMHVGGMHTLVRGRGREGGGKY